MDHCVDITNYQSVNALACYSEERCGTSSDGSKDLCEGPQFIACPPPVPVYECVNKDGTKYIWHQD